MVKRAVARDLSHSLVDMSSKRRLRFSVEDHLIDSDDEPSPIKKHVDKLDKDDRLLETVECGNQCVEKPSPLNLRNRRALLALNSCVDVQWGTASNIKDTIGIEKELSSPLKFQNIQSADSAQQSTSVSDSHLAGQQLHLACSSASATCPVKSSLSSTCGHHEEDLDSLSFVQESLQERSAANDASSVHVNPLSNESLEVSDCSGLSCGDVQWEIWGKASSSEEKIGIEKELANIQSADSAQQSAAIPHSHLAGQELHLACSSTSSMKSTLSSACGHQGDDLDSLSFVQESLQDRSAANDALSVHVNPLTNELLEVSDCCESTASVEWWDIVPPELEDESDEYSNSIYCSPTLSFKDEIDKSGLLEELKDLHEHVERAGSRIDNRDSDPLFANSNICVKEFVILLLGIVTRHHLTSVALEDILELINIISPVGNNVPKDTVEVYAFFGKHAQRIVKHFFCPNKKCQAYISNTSLQGKEKCKVCDMKVAEEAMFLEIPVQDQLKAVLSAPGVLDKLSYRFRRQKLSESAIEDVYDGHLYKQLSVENGFLSDPNNISLLGNTDGVSLVHSTRAGVWPVYYIINELPPIERFSRCNRLFAGIWFGKGKPHFPTFMKPFCESIKDLYLKGVKIDEESGTTIRGILLDTTMDAPARSSWLGIKQFNGYCGCPACTEPGKQLDLGPGKKNSRRQCHIYPFNIEMAQSTGHAKRRTHDVVKKQAVAAMTQISQKGKVTNPLEGVLGLSWAFALPFHDVIAGTAVDYMHCICEGVVDQHLRAWFDDKSSENYLGGSLEEIDGQFLSLRPISQITRRPRSISDWKQWKANEKRAFLLYYCIPLLCGRLSDDSFMHLAFLVGGIYRLLKDSISEQDVLEASAFLKLYCAQAPRFYGERFQTFNVHQVLHLKDAVQNLGPLWSNSCFPFEDFNGDLSGYFHGSQNIQGQIVKTICVHQSLPRLAETLTEGSVAKQFYKNLTSRNYRCRTVGEEISEGTFVVGSVERVWAASNLLTEEERTVVGPVLRVWVFRRAIINGIEYQSSLYKRTTARNNFTVVFKDRGKSHYGSVLKFLKCQAKCNSMQCSSKCSCSLPFFFIALVQKMRNHATQLPSYQGIRVIQHVTRVTLGEVISIPLSAIKKKCMRIDLDSDVIFVTHMANNFEKD